MSSWINGNDLIVHWGIEDFELFDFLKKGLQPYSRLGKQVVDSDSLERGRGVSIEKIESNLRAGKISGYGTFAYNFTGNIPRRLTENQIKPHAKFIYASQKLQILNPPKDCILMSFTLPKNANEAYVAIEKTKYFLFEKAQVSEFAKKNGLRALDEHGVDQSSVITEQDQNARCEDFVRSLRFYFENESEVKIQEPGKKSKTFTHESLGFDRLTDEWRWFIAVIEGPKHFYEYGPAKKGHLKIKGYERNRSRLREINKKIVEFLKKEYHIDPPEGFKTFEKAPKEGPGVFRFKFQVGKKVEKSKYDKFAKKDLLAEIERLSKQAYTAEYSDDLSKQSQLSEISDSLIIAATCAYKKEWLTEEKMSDYLEEHQLWNKEEDVYASSKKFPDSDSIH